MPRERILIVVKTYPTLSRKYGETVCTAGVREDGTWVRLYPVPFRRLNEKEKYSKFDWVECRIDRNTSDPRPESFRPAAFEEIRCVGHMDTSNEWRERRRLLLETAKVHTRLGDLIEAAKANTCSLAVFKPKKITKFSWDKETRKWDPKKLAEFLQKDLHFFLGTTQRFHLIAPNPWVIIGVFPIPHERQLELF
jgi:hypothetical protein